MLRLALAFLLLLIVPPTASLAGPDERLLALRQALSDRLALMEDVARYKWNAGLPIEDKAREAVVLEATIAAATRHGLDPAHARRVVEAQIAAAKAVQSVLFEAWTAASAKPFADVPSLTETLRPQIGRLTVALLISLKAAEDDLANCDVLAVLAPVPEALSAHPDAWSIAVNGALVAPSCP